MISLDRLGKLHTLVRRNRRGAVAVVAAVATPLVVGFAGLGVEVGAWQTSKRTLQTAADAAAGSGAIERAYGRSATVIREAALREAGRNGFISQNEFDAVVHNPPRSGAYSSDPAAVEIVLSRPQQPLVSKVMFGHAVAISARAVATMSRVGQACVLALDPTASGAVTNTGSTDVNLGGCVVAANSKSETAITVTGNGILRAQSLYTVGNYQRDGSSTLTLTQPAATHMWAAPNPFASVTVPSPGSCAHSGKRFDKIVTTINPGTYCFGIAIGAQAVVTMNPGVYIMNRGDFAVNGQAEVKCNCSNGEGVTIILTSSGSDNQIGRVIINGGAKVDLAAPSYEGAPYRGLLMMQDARVPASSNSASNKLTGGSDMILKGGLYFPAAEVQWSGNNATSNCIQVVARNVTFIGNSRLEVSGCAAAGVPPVQITAAKLVE